ncbi:MAG TPA: anthrone oxygenase family protein, partial [Mycobacterium sp.]|nr:anthrone oxygenase family protein [Mycobacterium sp.]
LAVTAPFTVDESHALLRALGAALYLVGTFGVTIAINVPMNVQLESADAGSAEGGEVWHRYLRRWTAWNTLRTILGAAASALLVTSLV